jgi:hypothetical protein
MEANLGAGYGKRFNQRVVTGYWSWRKGGKSAIEADLRSENQQATFWVLIGTGKDIITQGEYVEVDGEIYLVIEDDNFVREGGFTRCVMQLVSGNTDEQRPHRRVNLGEYQ